jgi:hypothetical protein
MAQPTRPSPSRRNHPPQQAQDGGLARDAVGFDRYIVLLSGNPPKEVEVALKVAAVVDVFLRKPIRKKTMLELPVMQAVD